MPDCSFLSWPFFDDSNRKIRDEALHLITRNENLRGISSGEDTDHGCRMLVKSFGHSGLLKHAVPASTDANKTKFDVRNLCLIRETLAYHHGLWDFVFAMQGLGSAPVVLFGSQELKKKYLPKVTKGQAVPAFAISEPDAGSDLRAMQATAKRFGDHFVITGTKTWISNAELADFYVVFCRFPEGGDESYVALVVPENSPGLSIERLEVIAPHPIGTLRFENCRVARSALIGKEGDGLKIALSVLDIFRPTVGAAALGLARRALDEAVAFVQTRRAFGKNLSEFQMTKNKLADMAVAIDASALLVYRAAWTHDVLQRTITREAAMAKLHATEGAQQVIDEAVQILGARGVVSGSITEQLYREVRALRIYEGTSEIQKLVIAGQVLKTAGETRAE